MAKYTREFRNFDRFVDFLNDYSTSEFTDKEAEMFFDELRQDDEAGVFYIPRGMTKSGNEEEISVSIKSFVKIDGAWLECEEATKIADERELDVIEDFDNCDVILFDGFREEILSPSV